MALFWKTFNRIRDNLWVCARRKKANKIDLVSQLRSTWVHLRRSRLLCDPTARTEIRLTICAELACFWCSQIDLTCSLSPGLTLTVTEHRTALFASRHGNLTLSNPCILHEYYTITWFTIKCAVRGSWIDYINVLHSLPAPWKLIH